MIKYDIKMSKYFTGTLYYTKEDYITGETYEITFRYTDGKLTHITHRGNDEEKGEKVIQGNPKRWNENFWKKAPRFVNCDDCCYRRTNVLTNCIVPVFMDSPGEDPFATEMVIVERTMFPLALA